MVNIISESKTCRCWPWPFSACDCVMLIFTLQMNLSSFAFRDGCRYGRPGNEPVFQPRPVQLVWGDWPGLGVLGLVICSSHHKHWRGKRGRCLPAWRDGWHPQQPTTTHTKRSHCVHWLLLHQSFSHIQGDTFTSNFNIVFSKNNIYAEIISHIYLCFF